MKRLFFLFIHPSGRRWTSTIWVVAILLAVVFIGSWIGSGGSKSILILPALVILPAAWWLIPPPRAFKVLLACLVLMPLNPIFPLGILKNIPVLNTLRLGGQILLGLVLLYSIQLAARHVRPPAVNGTWLAMLIFVLGGIVALSSATDDASYNWWGRVCLLAMITLYVTATVVRTLEQAERLLIVIVTCMAVLGLVMYILLNTQVGAMVAPQSNWELSMGRLGGGLFFATPAVLGSSIYFSIGANAPQLGEYVAIGLAVSFAYMLGAQSNKGRLGALALVLLLSVILVLTQARGAIIAVGVAWTVISALCLVWPVSNRSRLLLRWLVLLGLVLPFAYLVLLSRIKTDPTGGELARRLVNIFNNDPTLLGRLALWPAAWTMIQRHFFGYGFAGAFMPDGFSNPHNLYLWILQGSGWVGAFGLVLALGGLGMASFRGLRQAEPRQRVLSIAALGVLVVVLVEGFGSIVFANDQITTAFWAVMGVTLAVNGRGQGGSI